MANIHDDILDYNILTKLPLESLLRFKCVSKHWYSLITSSTFINLHQLYGHANLMMVSARSYHSKPRGYSLCTYLYHPHLKIGRDLDIWINSKQYNKFPYIIGCSNGLFCYNISDLDIRNLVVCNPLTMEHRSLIDGPINLIYNPVLTITCGFGYDSLGRDYKIVKFFFRVFQHKLHINEPERACYVQVYCLSRKSWKVTKSAPSTVLGCIDRAVVINNRLHWRILLREKNDTDNGCCKILTFDLHNEDFGCIAFPITFDKRLMSFTKLMECNGRLYTRLHYGGDVSIWVMKEYGVIESWTKICQLNTREIFGGPSEVVTYRSSREDVGEVVFLTQGGYELVWYNIESHNSEKVLLPEKKTYYDPWECIGTLASIDSLLD